MKIFKNEKSQNKKKQYFIADNFNERITPDLKFKECQMIYDNFRKIIFNKKRNQRYSSDISVNKNPFKFNHQCPDCGAKNQWIFETQVGFFNIRTTITDKEGSISKKGVEDYGGDIDDCTALFLSCGNNGCKFEINTGAKYNDKKIRIIQEDLFEAEKWITNNVEYLKT